MTESAAFGTGGFATTRIFAASRDRVWREWTEPDRFADWFGGVECEIPPPAISMDVRPGGAWRATMFCGSDRREIRWSGEYHEVAPPERLVFTFSNQSSAGRYELVTVVLTDLGDGRTQMHFTQRGHMRPDEYERTQQGWDTFFARLDQRIG